MAEMVSNRRKWILEKGPKISAVTNKFPPLEEYDTYGVSVCVMLIALMHNVYYIIYADNKSLLSALERAQLK